MLHILSEVIIQVQGVSAKCNRYLSRAGVIQYTSQVTANSDFVSRVSSSPVEICPCQIESEMVLVTCELISGLGPEDDMILGVDGEALDMRL